ncbi:Fic family protein [Burkholderia cenocepacia]|uniref:Fic family protein n=1 Tax=Burkholderia cenocepacia TaxID=95486 RepID=UPI002AB70C9E|nr:Fic family protein [Burkholderia cenocepacia]
MPNKSVELLNMIDSDKAMLDAARPLPKHTAASLREKLMLDWIYHSNALAGNTLTLLETKVVLEGITVAEKTLREHLEATNHREAIVYVEGIVSKAEVLSEIQIRKIHSLVVRDIDVDEEGRYRDENVEIHRATATPPASGYLRAEVASLIDWYGTSNDQHPVERAAELHTRFLKIRPFVDGNGRTARLLLNLELMREGYPPAIIREQDRHTYSEAIEGANASGDFRAITRLVSESLGRSFRAYLDLLGTSRADVHDSLPSANQH